MKANNTRLVDEIKSIQSEIAAVRELIKLHVYQKDLQPLRNRLAELYLNLNSARQEARLGK